MRRRGRDGEGVGGLGARNHVEATEPRTDTALVQQVCWRGRLAAISATPGQQEQSQQHLEINDICDLDRAMQSNVQILIITFYVDDH